ncbi:hypothetical protein GF373_15615 [bacterium]|nr:hypothetical protein [bacterium]
MTKQQIGTLTADDNMKAAGNATEANGNYTVKGNGDDIWGTADEGYFIYTEKSGNVSITANLYWVDPGPHDWAKMITMIRDKGDALGSKYFGSQMRGANLGDAVHATMRTEEDGGSNSTQFYYPPINPDDPDEELLPVMDLGDGIWVRTTRIADMNLFFSEWSDDGSTWHLGEWAEIEMDDPVAVGLAVTNHVNDENAAIGEFREVEFTDPPQLPEFGQRSVSAGSFQPGDTLDVTISVGNPNASASNVSVVDNIPEGWTASDISDGGSVSGNTITWDLSAEHGYTELTYKITAPDQPGFVNIFSGQVGDMDLMGTSALTMAQDKPEGDQIFDQHADIFESLENLGSEEVLGTAEYDAATDTYTVSGAGNDIWNEADNFHFLYTPVTGDFTLEADIQLDETERSTSTDGWIKAMLMARQNLTPGSPNFGTRVRRDGQFSWQYRASQDGSSSSDGDDRVTLNYKDDGFFPRMKLERIGDEWNIYYQDEAGDWIQVQTTQTLALGDPVLVGLAVTAHQAGSIQYALYRNVVLETSEPASILQWSLY